MRLSTNTIYDTGTSGLLRQTSDIYRTQQQLSTGRRILAPSDDPVASARVLELDQSKTINEQYGVNRRDANSTLAFQEAQIGAVSDLVKLVRDRVVQAGGGALTDNDRKTIAAELRNVFGELVGLANTKDANGTYMFAGFQSASQPFSGSVDAGVVYTGDDGQRMAQIGASRQIAVSDSGNELFMRARTGNGEFTVSPGATNAGIGVTDQGQITDITKWNAAGNSGDYSIVFDVTNGVTTYDIVDSVSGDSLLTGSPAAAAPYPRTFQSGMPISLAAQGAEPAFDLGARFTVTGQPASGDSFSLTRSGTQSVFQTVSDVIHSLESPVSGNDAAKTRQANLLAATLSGLDQVGEKLLTVRAEVGARQSEIEALDSLGENLSIQYEDSISNLQDLNFTEAISRFTQQQAYLQAAQQSFLRVTGLSLFNYIGS